MRLVTGCRWLVLASVALVLLVPPQELPCIGCQEVSLGAGAFVAHAKQCLAVAIIAMQEQHQQLLPDQQPPPDDSVEILAPPPIPDIIEVVGLNSDPELSESGDGDDSSHGGDTTLETSHGGDTTLDTSADDSSVTVSGLW